MSRKSLESLGRRAAAGLHWILAQTVVAKAVGLACQLALAALLAPELFGLIGLTYTVTMFANLIVNPGIDDAWARHPRRRQLTSAAFWLSLGCGILGSVLMIVAAPLAAWAYEESRLTGLIITLALGSAIGSLGTVPVAELRARLQFKRLAVLNFGEVVCQQVLMVVFAWAGFGAYSFVLPMPIVALARTAAAWMLAPTPLRPRGLARRRWPVLWGSSGLIFAARVLQTATGQGGQLTMGILDIAKATIGLYFFAFNLSTQVLQVVAQSVSVVLMPTMSLIHHDEDRLAVAVERAARVLALVAVPAAVLQALLAGPLLRLLSRPAYQDAIPLLQILGLVPVINSASWPLGSMLTAQGRFGTMLRIWLVNAILFFALIVPGTWMWGVRGTAVAVLTFGWIGSLVPAAMVGAPFARWHSPLTWSGLPIVGAALGAAASLPLLADWIGVGRFSDVLRLVLAPLTFGAVYLLTVWMLDAALVRELADRLLAPLRAARPTVGAAQSVSSVSSVTVGSSAS